MNTTESKAPCSRHGIVSCNSRLQQFYRNYWWLIRGNHWNIIDVTGTIFERLNPKEQARVMTCDETARVLPMVG